jgi:hypothetical protein
METTSQSKPELESEKTQSEFIKENEIQIKQPSDLTSKLIDLFIIGSIIVIMSYIFIPSIRNNWFEIMLNVLMGLSIYIVFVMFII